MIFQHTLEQVLTYRKTQTRRLVQADEIAQRGRYNRIEAVFHNERLKWHIGRTYAVQPGRGKAQVARIRLEQINSERLRRIRTADALAEGFPSRQSFLQTWRDIHGENMLDVRVWVLTFELVKCVNIKPVTDNYKALSHDFR